MRFFAVVLFCLAFLPVYATSEWTPSSAVQAHSSAASLPGYGGSKVLPSQQNSSERWIGVVGLGLVFLFLTLLTFLLVKSKRIFAFFRRKQIKASVLIKKNMHGQKINLDDALLLLNDTASLNNESPSPLCYGGFWRRAAAIFIDLILIQLIGFIINLVYGYICGVEIRTASPRQVEEILTRLNRFSIITGWGILFFYFALFESSVLQATPGKLLLKMKVYGRNGRISFLRACARTLAKFLSAVPLGMGFIMAAFSRKKQALHDFITNTQVLKK